MSPVRTREPPRRVCGPLLCLLSACVIASDDDSAGPLPGPPAPLNDALATWTGADPGLGALLRAAPAGDVDGDGFDDLLVAEPGHGDVSAERGRVHLLLGVSLRGPLSFADAHMTLLGDVQGDRLGEGLAAAGDVDADGLDDVLLGAPGSTDLLVSTPGKVYLVRGPTLTAGGTVEATTADLRFPGYLPEDFTGSAVAGGGDVDGDGLSDILIGAPGADADAPSGGRAWLFLGSQLGDQGTMSLASAHTTFAGAAGDWLGRAASFVPDIDGDGRSEVLLGGSGGALQGDGQGLWLLWSGATASAGGLLGGTLASSQMGTIDGINGGFRVLSITPVGDTDGDGHGELLSSEGRFLADSFRGWASWYGSSLPGSPWPLPGIILGWSGDPSEADHVALVVAGAGDLNGDGGPDLAIAAPYVERPLEGRGRVHLFAGPLGPGPERLLDTAEIILDGLHPGDHLGAITLGAGDIDADGQGDLVISAPGWDRTDGPEVGRIWVLSGGTLPWPSSR